MTKRTPRGGRQPPSIQISESGLGKNEMVMMAISVATIVLSIAIWKVATGIKWALIILAGGQSAYWTLVGIGRLVRMRFEGRTLLERAKGRNLAEITAARRGRLLPPGELS